MGSEISRITVTGCIRHKSSTRSAVAASSGAAGPYRYPISASVGTAVTNPRAWREATGVFAGAASAARPSASGSHVDSGLSLKTRSISS